MKVFAAEKSVQKKRHQNENDQTIINLHPTWCFRIFLMMVDRNRHERILFVFSMFIERTPTEVGRGLLTTSLNLPVKMMKIGRIQMRRKNKLITFNLTGNLLNNRLKMELTTPRNKQTKTHQISQINHLGTLLRVSILNLN